MKRHFWVLVHRYAGLFMAFFLVIIGLTGSIIVFNAELNDWLDPLPKVIAQPGPELEAQALRERAQAFAPKGMINMLGLHRKTGDPYVAGVEPRIDPATGEAYPLDFTTLILDPYSGAELGRRNDTSDIWPIRSNNIMVLINRLHYQMAIPGSFGSYLFGVVALVWTLDCIVSAYLTFPASLRRRNNGALTTSNLRRRSWLARWWNPAWLVKWRGSAYRVNFDLHRAGGLWVWIMLLALAWSSVGFNLADEVYLPVMKTVFNMPDPYGGNLPKLAAPRQDPAMDWRTALEVARRIMADQASATGFTVSNEDSLLYEPDKGVFLYSVRSNRDLLDDGASTTLLFDDQGRFMSLSLPTGQNAGGTLHTWIFALHMAQIWGLPFRIFVSCTGILVALLSVTGVYIWLKKRGSRGASHKNGSKMEGELTT